MARFHRRPFMRRRRRFIQRRRQKGFQWHVNPNRPLLAQNRKIVRMRFALNGGEPTTLTSAAGAVVGAVWSCNGLFDPQIALGGAQPRGFDQWMALYTAGICIGSKITATFSSINTTLTGHRIYITQTENAGLVTAKADIEEHRHLSIGTLSDSTDLRTLRMTYSMRKEFQVANPLDAGDFFFNALANPQIQKYYQVGTYNLNSIATSDISYSGHIDYFCVLAGVQQPAQS